MSSKQRCASGNALRCQAFSPFGAGIVHVQVVPDTIRGGPAVLSAPRGTGYIEGPWSREVGPLRIQLEHCVGIDETPDEPHGHILVDLPGVPGGIDASADFRGRRLPVSVRRAGGQEHGQAPYRRQKDRHNVSDVAHSHGTDAITFSITFEPGKTRPRTNCHAGP